MSTDQNFLRAPRKNSAPFQITPGAIAKLQRRREFTRDRQARYAKRMRERREPPTHRIAAALLAAFVTSDLSEKDKLVPITEAMLTRLAAANYDLDAVKRRLKAIRRRLLGARRSS